ncbi:MAG: CRTAC1 family protein [Planctomycetota bacterium]
MTEPKTNSGTLFPVLGLIVLVLVGLAAWYLSQPADNPKPDPNPDSVATEKRATFDTAVEALAAAEDLEFSRAVDLWTGLVEKHPEEDAFRINQGVTVLRWIEETAALLSTGNIDEPEEIQRLEQELEKAHTYVESAIEILTQSEAAGSKGVFLHASLLAVQADQLDYPEDEKLQRQAAELLAAELKKDPAQPILATKFDSMIEVLGGEDKEENAEFFETLCESFHTSWQADPRNLHLLTRSLLLLTQAEDKRVAEIYDYSLEVTKPMGSEVGRSLQQLERMGAFEKIKSALEKEDWKSLRTMRQWVYVIKGMRSAYQPDRRLVIPNVLALLDTSILDRLAEELPGRPSSTTTAPTFSSQSLGVVADVVHWFDIEIDLDFDLAIAQENQIRLFESQDGKFTQEAVAEFDVGFKISDFLIAEFFTVESPNRRRSKTVADLVAEKLPKPSNDGEKDLVLSPEQQAIANRHDTLQELFVWGKDGIAFLQITADGANQLQLAEKPTGLEEVKDVHSAAVFDIESDGDLDLFLLTGSGPQVWQNNGNRTFENTTEFSTFEDFDPSAAKLVSGDIDSDLDQDILCVAPKSPRVHFFENILHGQLRHRVLDQDNWPELDSPNDLAVGEMDGAPYWDLIVSGEKELQVTTSRSDGESSLLPLARTSELCGSNSSIAEDFNNDGWLDIALASPSGLKIALGSEDGLLQAQAIDGIDGPIVQFDATDFNSDGVVDLALISDGRVSVLTGAEDQQKYLNARVRGRNDDNGGGRINYFSVGSTVELWNEGRQQRRIVSTPVTHFGLGSGEAQNLRIVFPNGLTQNLEEPPANSLIQEVQELKGSCPFVYGWNGEQFELITDLLWNAPLGLQIARGETLADRRWEYLALPADLMQPKDGFYELRVTEELWEIAYFDTIQLTSVDYPHEYHNLYTNEKVGPPNLAQPQLFLPSDLVFPKAAFDSKGRDVSAHLKEVDQVYVRAFDQLICQGLAEPHFIELDFNGRIPEKHNDLRLFLRGWLHPTDTSLNIGISQNPDRLGPEPPSLWVVDQDGQWVCAQPFMGFPGGKPKSIVVDLQDVFVSKDHRLRIASSQQIYWDQAFIAADSKADKNGTKEQLLELHSAELHFRGFSRLTERTIDEPHWYDYQDVSLAPKWPELEGPFTGFGDASNLLRSDDDQMVVMTSGDEIVLRFRIPESEVPAGWKRGFVLHCTGWDKDADLNTIAGQGSLPLPFMAQKGYPATPDQEEQSREVWRKNADNLTRERQYMPESQGL